MNFQDMPKIENSDTILDITFRSAKEAASRTSTKYRRAKPMTKVRKMELSRIDVVKKRIQKRLKTIHDDFPSINALHPFYEEIIINSINIDLLKKSLASLTWVSKKISELHKQCVVGITKNPNKHGMERARRGFYGRVSSVLKQINSNLVFLESARKTMRQFPDIKELRTIAIAGYPNVGKSSLLNALTTSDPEIAEYAFTTKKLNIGYIKTEKENIQLIDAPGALDRDKMNMIEMQAILVIKHVADKILFMIDPSETCGYGVSEQLGLLKRLKKMSKMEFVVVFNKIDIVDVKTLQRTAKEVHTAAGKLPIIPISIIKNKNIGKIKDLL